MQKQKFILIKTGKKLRFVISFLIAPLMFFLISCSGDFQVQRENSLTIESELLTYYSIVFVIHGDGNYLYHDSNGKDYNADEVVLEKAIQTAIENQYAEVFIFHQKPKENFLFFFPQKDGEFYYYRKGELINNEKYWRDESNSYFDIETKYYENYRVNNKNEIVNIFLYFGHEIPEYNKKGYDESYPDKQFNIEIFSEGLKSFTNNSQKIDLLILSTCFGGTPYTISSLGKYSEYIIASPENLHLSYFDIQSLKNLEMNLQKEVVYTFSKYYAEKSFNYLIQNVETEVSVVVYDIKKVQNYLNSVREIYINTLLKDKSLNKDYLLTSEKCDCNEIDSYSLPTISDGVYVFYRSPLFGRTKNKKNHSGWQCIKNLNLILESKN